MWETTDPEGRPVVLSFERWRHILEDHAELGPHRSALLDTIANPDVRLRGRVRGEEWFYRRSSAPSRWIKVVVHFDRSSGRVVTAFPRRRLP